MRCILCIAAFFSFIFCSCKNSPKQDTPHYNNAKIQFYPINQFLHSQINDVSSTPYFIYGIRVLNNIRDSFVVSPELFKQLASEFVKQDISEPSIKNFYKETAFHDEGMQSITFNYTTSKVDLPIQSTDVLLDDASQSVKRVFITKQYSNKDSSLEMKLGWKKDESFFINKIIDKKTSKPVTEQLTVIWNDKTNRK